MFFSGGGGQEPDRGVVVFEGSSHVINHVKTFADSLRLYLNDQEIEIPEGTSIQIGIDGGKRTLNSRLHTAGHLLASVIYEEMKLDLVPNKGYHYQLGSHVEFSSSSDVRQVDIEDLNTRLSRNIEAALTVYSEIVTTESKSYINSFRTLAFNPPKDAQIRLVKIAGFLAYACGGTHVENTSELKGLKVTGFKFKKGHLRIKYEFDSR